MESKQRAADGCWWVEGLPDDTENLGCGPYRTRADAEEIRRGLERTYKYWEEPGFVTSDPATPQSK